MNPPSWYPQGRASNPKVNALDSVALRLLLRFVVDFFFWTFPFLSLLHTSLRLALFRSFSFPLLASIASFSCSRSRARWGISSGHERDVTAINPADTALARVSGAWGRLPHFLLLLLSFSFPFPHLLLFFFFFCFFFLSFFCFFSFFFFLCSFDLTTSASRTE